jgi:SAM-dependent methyltransferase
MAHSQGLTWDKRLVPKLRLGTPSAKLRFATHHAGVGNHGETEFRGVGSQTEFGNQKETEFRGAGTQTEFGSQEKQSLLRCVECHTLLSTLNEDGTTCDACGHNYPSRDGLLIAQGELTGKNRIAAAFYNSERWPRFRPWEQLFLKTLGGLPGARMQILRHLRDLRHGSLLEVGIGDGENVALLPRSLTISGIDIAERPLADCRDRFPDRGLFLALAEGERIPFADRSFDVVLSVGGFNFYSDPQSALSEMARVTKPGGRVVVADELPDLFEWGWGHLLGIPRLDDWLMRRFWLGPEFTDMVIGTRLDVAALARATLRRAVVHRIWRGLGYCIVGEPPHD